MGGLGVCKREGCRGEETFEFVKNFFIYRVSKKRPKGGGGWLLEETPIPPSFLNLSEGKSLRSSKLNFRPVNFSAKNV